MMDADEKEIYRYLKSHAGMFVAGQVICRHAGGRSRFQESPDWARSVLMRMKERGIVETDHSGAYRLKAVPTDLSAAPQWVSPQIAALLLRGGKQIPGAGRQGDDDEAYYDSL